MSIWLIVLLGLVAVIVALVLSFRKLFIDTGLCTESPDLKGKVVVITGTTSGIGKETAMRLATLGATVVLADRDAARSAAMAAKINNTTAIRGSAVSVVCDLSDLESVAKCAQTISHRFPAVHMLINNAGTMLFSLKPSKQGYEMQYATNHLGHFLLTALLLPAMLKTGKPRVVTLSSAAHTFAKASEMSKALLVQDFDGRTPETTFGGMKAYGRSKLANLLFTMSLQKRFGGQGLLAFAANPGDVDTELNRDFGALALFALWPVLKYCQKTPLEGAQTTLTCALLPEDKLVPGAYYVDRVKAAPGNPEGTDAELAEQLWQQTVSQVMPFLTTYASDDEDTKKVLSVIVK